MLKKLCLAAIALTMVATAGAQSQQPTKEAPTAGIDKTWKDGLSGNDIALVNRVARNKNDEDRWMIWTAIYRNREASRDMYKGEPLTNDRVLANVRVRMSTEESKRWTDTWSHLSAWDRQSLIRVLRDDLTFKH